MLLTRFDPPGLLDDLSEQAHTAWSESVSAMIDDAIAGDPEHFANDAPRAQFYNSIRTDTAADAVEKPIAWTAFSRTLKVNASSDHERWEVADGSRVVQDEYCEWSVERDGDKILRVTFTSEVPEYWQLLAVSDQARLLALYRDLQAPGSNSTT